MPTKIEWTDETWNPVTGCTKVSEGCKFCYAERLSKRFGQDFDVTLHPDRLGIPLRWRKPRRVFVVSMGDLFHEDVPDQFIDKVFAVMALTPWHTYQVLTKRPERIVSYINAANRRERITKGYGPLEAALTGEQWNIGGGWGVDPGAMPWPLPNVWLGVSVENQEAADERIPLLLETPAAVRFVSCEPLLSGLDLRDPVQDWGSGYAGEWDWLGHRFEPEHIPGLYGNPFCKVCGNKEPAPLHKGCLDWVIVGGESAG
ncbi:hypothetical protein LCGC14_2460460, partial [marine sediment metagenome]